MSNEVTNMSQSLQNCQNKHDLFMKCLDNLVKDAIQDNKGEKKEELMTIINSATDKLQQFAAMLVEEPKINPLKKRSFETSEEVPDKKLKLSPSPLIDLPNELWMKILSFLSTKDILKNFNLTCKHFHSLAINPCAIKSLHLKLENAKDSSQYQEIVKVLKRSKTLKKLIITGHDRMNQILAHVLKSNHLKTLEISQLRLQKAPLSNVNLKYIKNSNIEALKLDYINLDSYAMQQIGAVKTLKSVRILLCGYRKSISELIKTFIDAKIELEDLDIVAFGDLEIYPSVFSKFLNERAAKLKKLKIRCPMNDKTMKDERKWEKFSMKWNATSTLEELYYDDFGSQNGNCPIEFGHEMPKLTKLLLRNINGSMLQIFGTQKFPVLERLCLQKKFGNENVTQQTILNILENCPKLKSVKLQDFNLSNPQSGDTWCAFLCEMYKSFNVFIDIYGYKNWSINFYSVTFEKYLKKTDLATFKKYRELEVNYFDWKKEQPNHEW